MQCFSPINIPNPKYSTSGRPGELARILVPCGRCEACLTNRQNSWFVRIQEQVKSAETCVFVTLTYNDESLPRTSEGVPCVSRRDVQLFFKRLRKQSQKIYMNEFVFPIPRIWYFLCAEYGPNTWRPHYHFIVGNVPNLELLEKCWDKGFVSVGEVNDNRIRYCAKYIVEKTFYPDHLVPVFNLISKGVGIGYVDKMTAWHNSGDLDRFYVPYFDKKYPMPRYYREKIFDKSCQSEFSKLCEDRALEREQEGIEKYGSYKAYKIAEYRNQELFAERVKKKIFKNSQI